MIDKENKDFNFVKKFSKITIPNICRKEKIDRSNLISGKTTEINYKKARERIESEIAKLYIKED